MWLSVLLMAEAWGMHPEQVLRQRRSATWGARFAVLQEIRGRVQRGDKAAPAPLDGEPEWMVLERQMREGA